MEPGESKGSGSGRCFRVEYRIRLGEKALPDGTILTEAWKLVSTLRTQPPVGVKNNATEPTVDHCGYMSYHTAKAIQYVTHTELGHVFGLETRIVEFEYEVTHRFKRLREIEVVDGSYPHVRDKEPPHDR